MVNAVSHKAAYLRSKRITNHHNRAALPRSFRSPGNCCIVATQAWQSFLTCQLMIILPYFDGGEGTAITFYYHPEPAVEQTSCCCTRWDCFSPLIADRLCIPNVDSIQSVVHLVFFIYYLFVAWSLSLHATKLLNIVVLENVSPLVCPCLS